MSKHNYSQYSNKKNENKNYTAPEVTVEIQNGVENTVTEEVKVPVDETVVENNTVTVTENVVEPESTTETNTAAAVAKGVVANCAKLNIRLRPSTDGKVLTILNVNDEVSIDVDKSTDEWLKIRTVDGVKGYCMRKFVNANI